MDQSVGSPSYPVVGLRRPGISVFGLPGSEPTMLCVSKIFIFFQDNWCCSIVSYLAI